MNDTFNQKGLIINGKAKDGFTREGLIHSICRQITYHERLVLLKLLNNKHDVRYYSTACPEILSDVKYCGSTYYFSEMPKIFRFSKININASLRSIQSGIPLRALDIIGSRGFLLSNYQAEFEEYFVPGQDIVLYDSIPDAIEKANFYLSNESERQNIINRSFNIIETYFNYPMRIAELFRTAGLY